MHGKILGEIISDSLHRSYVMRSPPLHKVTLSELFMYSFWWGGCAPLLKHCHPVRDIRGDPNGAAAFFTHVLSIATLAVGPRREPLEIASLFSEALVCGLRVWMYFQSCKHATDNPLELKRRRGRCIPLGTRILPI